MLQRTTYFSVIMFFLLLPNINPASQKAPPHHRDAAGPVCDIGLRPLLGREHESLYTIALSILAIINNDSAYLFSPLLGYLVSAMPREEDAVALYRHRRIIHHV